MQGSGSPWVSIPKQSVGIHFGEVLCRTVPLPEGRTGQGLRDDWKRHKCGVSVEGSPWGARTAELRAQLQKRSSHGSSPRGSLCPAGLGQTSWLGSKSHICPAAGPRPGLSPTPVTGARGTARLPRPPLTPSSWQGWRRTESSSPLLVLRAGHLGLQEPPLGHGVCRIWGWGR